MTYALIHFPMSFPRDDQPSGWSDEFAGDYERYADFVVSTTRKLGGTDVLLRGYSDTAPKDAKWEVGYTAAARPITSGVWCSAALDDDVMVRRREMIWTIRDAGFRVWVHDGPATTREEALVSARTIADDRVFGAFIDSSGRNTSPVVALQLEAMQAFGVLAGTEPDGNPAYACLANAENFVLPAIKEGRDVSRYIAWLNNPSDEARDDPQSILGPCLMAGVLGTCVPHRMLAKMQGVG